MPGGEPAGGGIWHAKKRKSRYKSNQVLLHHNNVTLCISLQMFKLQHLKAHFRTVLRDTVEKSSQSPFFFFLSFFTLVFVYHSDRVYIKYEPLFFILSKLDSVASLIA